MHKSISGNQLSEHADQIKTNLGPTATSFSTITAKLAHCAKKGGLWMRPEPCGTYWAKKALLVLKRCHLASYCELILVWSSPEPLAYVAYENSKNTCYGILDIGMLCIVFFITLLFTSRVNKNEMKCLGCSSRNFSWKYMAIPECKSRRKKRNRIGRLKLTRGFHRRKHRKPKDSGRHRWRGNGRSRHEQRRCQFLRKGRWSVWWLVASQGAGTAGQTGYWGRVSDGGRPAIVLVQRQMPKIECHWMSLRSSAKGINCFM